MKLLKLKPERFNRSTFILSIISSYIALMVGGSLLGGLLILVSMLIVGPSTNQMNIGVLFLAPLIMIEALYFIYCVVNRFHDLGMSGWYTLAVFVPFLGTIFGILLLFIAGNESANKYGEPQHGIYIFGNRLKG